MLEILNIVKQLLLKKRKPYFQIMIFLKLYTKLIEIKLSSHVKNMEIFITTPTSLLNKHGCRKCGYEKNRKSLTCTTDNFIKKAREIYDEYDYSEAVYLGNP